MQENTGLKGRGLTCNHPKAGPNYQAEGMGKAATFPLSGEEER